MTISETFEAKYRCDEDPWKFRTSTYERGRYTQTMAALGRPHYLYAFEPGCSIGELTAQLATRCDRVFATDVSPTAVRRAAVRCAEFPGVEVQCSDLQTSMPPGPFDLIVASEIAYYFDPTTLRTMAELFSARLVSSGELVAVHWLGNSVDHVLHGDEAHEILLGSLPMLTWVDGRRFQEFRVDRWMKP